MKIVDRVRSRINVFDKPLSAADLRERLPDLGSDQIRAAIDHLILRGEIKAVSKGNYMPAGTVVARDCGGGKARILKAIHIKGTFSVHEIMALADSETRSTHRILRMLLDLGHIDEIGRKMGPSGHYCRVFRVRNRDEFYLKFILPNIKL